MVTKEAKRWDFLLRGYVIVTPIHNEDGEVEYMLVETELSAAKCYSPEEVNEAVDIAMYHAQYEQTGWVH